MDYEVFNKLWLKKNRRKLRKDATKAERVLWKGLRNKRVGYKFRRQHSIGPYIADFYSPDVKLAIELDGETHDDPKIQNRGQEKERYIESLNLKLIRFSNPDILKYPEGIIKYIQDICDKIKRTR